MISFIRGPVTAIEDDGLVVDIGALGLLVSAPMHMLQPRPVVGEEITLHTFLQVREDAWNLYGFADREQLRLFKLLLNISGIGAKTALAIVDSVSPSRFAMAVANKDAAPLTAVSGVGKKSAERILLELKDKFPAMTTEDGEAIPAPAPEALNRELLAALKQLGYSATEARSFAMQAQGALGDDAPAEELLRESLKIAMRA